MNKFFDKCRRDVELVQYTTFKIGGPADYFFVAKNPDDLVEAVKAAKQERIKYYILAGGSNILVADEGFQGLVIKVENKELRIKNRVVITGAGLALGKLVNVALDNNLTGVEFWTGVPGTIGGAIYGNAGAYGKDCRDVLKSVSYYDIDLDKIIKKEIKDLKFSYRSSEFKENKNKIILSCEIELKKGDKKKIRAEMAKIAKMRVAKIPIEPSAGSVFKNIATNLTQILDKSNTRYTDKKKFLELKKVPAALLIEKCGLKGKQIGGAKISEKHANFIVNMGGAKARDVLKLIKLVRNKVRKKFGVELELENILVGF